MGSRQSSGMCARLYAQPHGWESGHPSVSDHDSGALLGLEGGARCARLGVAVRVSASKN